MNDKRRIIVNAAQQLFLKYGYTKVNMSDIAKVSKMSRPLLYTVFNGKEAIYDSVIRKLADEITQKVKQEIKKIDEPLEKLDKVFQLWVLELQEELIKSDEAKELYESTFPFVQETMNEITQMFIKDIENVLKFLPKDSLNGGLSPKQLAGIFAEAISGFKKNGKTIEEVEKQIRLLVQATIKSE